MGPQALRIAVDICLNSRFPMFVWWGPQSINIYNDAYIPVLGQRHPWAFGQPAQEVWRDIWEVVGAQRDVVLQQGEPTWKFLATLAHELRNPLAPIRQAALVAKVAPDAKRREWALDVIERQVGHMALLLDDLLSNAAKYTDPGGHIALVAERGQAG